MTYESTFLIQANSETSLSVENQSDSLKSCFAFLLLFIIRNPFSRMKYQSDMHIHPFRVCVRNRKKGNIGVRDELIKSNMRMQNVGG
jgi:hypothetical protein